MYVVCLLLVRPSGHGFPRRRIGRRSAPGSEGAAPLSPAAAIKIRLSKDIYIYIYIYKIYMYVYKLTMRGALSRGHLKKIYDCGHVYSS